MKLKKNYEQELLLFLSKNQNFVTSEELAKTFDISTKTVYRLIKKINEEFNDGNLILSEKGRGYKLDYKKYISHKQIKKEKIYDLSPSERRNKIIEELLLISPQAKNVDELFERYYVTDYVIFNDEQLIAKELEKFDLKLVRKKRTLAINIRRAMISMIQMLNIIDIEEFKNNNFTKFNSTDIAFVLEQLKIMEEELEITIPYPYNVNIFSHLYILITRSKKFGKFEFFENIELNEEEKEEFEKDKLLKRISEKIISNIETYFGNELPETEIYYLYQYLVSSRMQGKLEKVTEFSQKVMQATQKYLDEMSIFLNMKIESDSIFLDLTNHIKPLFDRLEHGIKIQSSLLIQIKMTYEKIFSYVVEVSKLISKKFDLPEINEEENGFLTLYFARILETNQIPIKTFIMCTTGVGTSELLKVKVEKNFPELEIVDVVAMRNAKEIMKNYLDIELILTTVEIDKSIQIESLLVSAIFTVNDKARLQKKIEEIYNAKQWFDK